MKRLLAAACAAAWGLPAFGGGLQTGVPTLLAPIVVEGEAPLAGGGSSATEGVATHEQLMLRPRLRPGELLEIVPGLIVTQHSGGGKANQFFLRGFNLDHGTDFASFVDGMPVNQPTHAHGHGYTDLNFVIPELVGRIGYRKGPYFAESGDFSAAGSAELQLLDRLDSTLLRGELGERGYRRALLAGSAPLGRGALLYGLEGHQQDGPWDVPEDLRRLNAQLRYSQAQPHGTLSITAMAYDGRWTATDQIPLRAVESGALGRYGSLDPSDGGDSHRYSLSLAWQGSGAHAGWRASAYAIDGGLQLYSNFTYFLDDPVAGDQFEQFDDRRVFGAALGWERHGDLAGVHVHHSAGLQLRYDDIDTVGLYRTQARARRETVREDRVTQTMAGLHYSFDARWYRWLRSIAGLRADLYDYAVTAQRADNSGDGAEMLLSPKLSLVLGPWAATEFFVNAGGGFHSNDARGATLRVDPVTGAAAEPVDPLVPARGAELGMRTRWGEGLQTALALWLLELDSEQLFVGDAGSTEASRPSRRHGVEASVYWPLGAHWILDADAALSRARFSDRDPAGSEIPGAIERTASAGLVYDSDTGAFGGLRLRYFGSRPLVEDGSLRSAASTLVNLRAGYAFSPAVSLAVEVLNLFDREVRDIEYFYASRLAGETAPVEDRHFHPAEPRTLRIQLAARF